MKNSHFMCVHLVTLLLVVVFSAGLSLGQEGFKGGGTIFTRPVKKAHGAKRPSTTKVPVRATEANKNGDAQFDAGRYQEAITSYRQAINLYPRYAEAYLNLGDTCMKLERYEDAVTAYQQAIKLQPNYADAYNGLGDTYEELDRQVEADAAHKRANAHYPTGGLLNGKAITLVQPSYPAIARSARASGEVVVHVLVDETGQVMRARAVSGHPLLMEAAVKAASQSVFAPSMLRGQPVKVTGTIVYDFAL